MSFSGNKAIPGVIHKIINNIPPCTKFYEPFAGSAAVSSFLSLLSGINVRFFLNDLDPAVIANIDYPAGSTVTNVNGISLLQSLNNIMADKDTFVFMDPPYLKSTRLNSLFLYDYDMSVPDHELLLSLAAGASYNCMIIHPVCDLYNHHLKSFFKIPVKIRYHSKTSNEALYMNYPSTGKLLTYVYAGTNCWDRQRIKRKGDRLVSKLMSVPAVERNYLLDRIKKSFIEDAIKESN